MSNLIYAGGIVIIILALGVIAMHNYATFKIKRRFSKVIKIIKKLEESKEDVKSKKELQALIKRLKETKEDSKFGL